MKLLFYVNKVVKQCYSNKNNVILIKTKKQNKEIWKCAEVVMEQRDRHSHYVILEGVHCYLLLLTVHGLEESFVIVVIYVCSSCPLTKGQLPRDNSTLQLFQFLEKSKKLINYFAYFLLQALRLVNT